jgi:hypothetical protein
VRIPTPPPATARILATRVGLAVTLAAAALLAGATVGLAAAPPSPSPGALRPAPVVAILLSPFLTYDDLSPGGTPVLWSLAEKGAVGSMNAVTADPGWPTVAGGALSLSAGRWAGCGGRDRAGGCGITAGPARGE